MNPDSKPDSEARPAPAPGESPGAGDALREQQAIAAAMLVGERMRREERKQLYWYAKRVGIFTIALAAMGLVMLFGYAQLSKGEFNPTLLMIVLGAVAGVGAVVTYWAHTEERRSAEE